jgi:hypothetical protein
VWWLGTQVVGADCCKDFLVNSERPWIPAFAGMTAVCEAIVNLPASSQRKLVSSLFISSLYQSAHELPTE